MVGYIWNHNSIVLGTLIDRGTSLTIFLTGCPSALKIQHSVQPTTAQPVEVGDSVMPISSAPASKPVRTSHSQRGSVQSGYRLCPSVMTEKIIVRDFLYPSSNPEQPLSTLFHRSLCVSTERLDYNWSAALVAFLYRVGLTD